jgi:hypothetical protein
MNSHQEFTPMNNPLPLQKNALLPPGREGHAGVAVLKGKE